MATIKFKLDRDAVRDLLRSQEMESICKEHANQVAARSGIDCEVDTRVGKNRVNAMVTPGSAQAYYDNLEQNSLIKAIKGGGL